jgi:hypothetical protein
LEGVAVTEWAPATEAEAAMRDALRVDDQELYFRILSRVELLLPVSAEAIAGRAPMGWGTWTAGERTHVLAFTSPQAMRACLAEHAGSARRIPYYELAAAWPNLDWWLAVDPGLPIEGYLPAWFVSQLARGDVRVPGRSTGARLERAETLGRARVPPQSRSGMLLEGQLAGPPPAAEGQAPEPAAVTSLAADDLAEPDQAAFEPANDLEAGLFAAASSGDAGQFLSVLLLAKVLLPVAEGADPAVHPAEAGFVWRTDPGHEAPHVVVFTSRERLSAHLDGSAEVLGVRFVQLIRAWPGESWSLVVNPGTPIGAVLPGSQIAGLAQSAAEVGLDDDAGEAGESGADAAARAAGAARPALERPIPMQKVVAPSQVGWYLDRSYDRVCGFVHRQQEVAHLGTPARLVAGLGLRYDGSPFDPGADVIYILRWDAYRPTLYRIPYGGRTEAAMAAMEGWVIERAPFRGNGFTPAESDEVIAEFKVDSIRLPHGAQLWRLAADGTARLVAVLDADGPAWRRVER